MVTFTPHSPGQDIRREISLNVRISFKIDFKFLELPPLPVQSQMLLTDQLRSVYAPALSLARAGGRPGRILRPGTSVWLELYTYTLRVAFAGVVEIEPRSRAIVCCEGWVKLSVAL
jgi:hypothetical protein